MTLKYHCCTCRSYRKRVVWMVDRQPYCNGCYVRWSEWVHDILDHKVDRITMDDNAFCNPRKQKQVTVEG